MRLETPRLILRPWTDADRAPFHSMSADPEVMRYLKPRATRAESDAWIDRQLDRLAADGFCFLAVEERASAAFIGSVGLLRVSYEAHFTPAVEIGWRFARAAWGQGYAPEAAAACLHEGFTTLGLAQIVADAAVDNIKSQRVMQKLGMSRDPADDYDHPTIAEGDPLRRQVLYRISRDQWLASPQSAREASRRQL